MKECPYNVGDVIIYSPTIRGRGQLVMTDLAQLKIGAAYTIKEIDCKEFIVIEGFESAIPSSKHWSELRKP